MEYSRLLVQSDAQQTREDYLPDDVRVLFIGESPPSGGTFFYYTNSNLYRATRDAFARAIPALRGSQNVLNEFCKLGCYLEDLAVEPVDDLPRRERRAACNAGIAPLAERIRPLHPRVVVIVGYGIAPKVTKALVRAGHGELDREKLPFPTTRRRQTDKVPYRQLYIDELSTLVDRWRKRHILASLRPSAPERMRAISKR